MIAFFLFYCKYIPIDSVLSTLVMEVLVEKGDNSLREGELEAPSCGARGGEFGGDIGKSMVLPPYLLNVFS